MALSDPVPLDLPVRFARCGATRGVGACGLRAPGSLVPGEAQRGVALILVLIFTVLLYALIADLVVTARSARLSGDGDALLDKMRNHMVTAVAESSQMLLDDMMAAAGLEEGEGAEGAGGGLLGGGLDGGGEGDESEEDPSTAADGSQDAWYAPTSYAEGDITTYVWIEDENRKFNVLSLVSPDREFAELSRRRFADIVDWMREGTEFDLTESDGITIADQLIDYMRSRDRNDWLPKMPLKSDVESGDRQDISLLVHMDEMLLLRSVDEDLFYDKVLDGRKDPRSGFELHLLHLRRLGPG